MAFVDPASAVLVTTATGGLGLLAANRSSSWVREFALIIFGLCAFDITLWILTPLVYVIVGVLLNLALAAHLDELALPILFLAVTVLAPWIILHLPSILILGLDENLERHGVIATSAGLVADYLLWAVLLAAVAWSWRALFREDGSRVCRRAR